MATIPALILLTNRHAWRRMLFPKQGSLKPDRMSMGLHRTIVSANIVVTDDEPIARLLEAITDYCLKEHVREGA